MKILGSMHTDWLERRGISSETAVRYGIYTGRSVGDPDDRTVIADSKGNVLVFPYSERGVDVNEKYRGPDKRFWQSKGGRKTFWNADALDDPGLYDGSQVLNITEGEIDALTAIDCGFPLSVSVPDGAPGVPKGANPEELGEQGDDRSGKFEFLYNNRERIKLIKKFRIVVDNDAPGKRLAAELVRRLSASRCQFVTYPDGVKDLNQTLMEHGRDAVVRVLNSSKPYPVKGLYELKDYSERGDLEVFKSGWYTLDHNVMVFPGEFMVVTGIPGHGKSTFVLNLLVNWASMYGWRAAIFSPEMPTIPHMRGKFRRMIQGAPGYADSFISDYFCFIDADPSGIIDDDFDLAWVIDKAKDAVLRYGIKVLVIDPWNEVEHARLPHETVTDYIGRGIRMLKRFAREYQVMVIVVAHPTKEVGRDGKARAPTLYDIEGSAHWFNKCDHGLIVVRPDAETNQSVVRVSKVRFDETGNKGECKMLYDQPTCRFTTLDGAESIRES